jgi:transposase
MQPIFKQYNQGQIELFPQRLDEYIGENDPVRLVSQVVDALDITNIIKSYKGGGTSSFCPRMMIKVLFYAYMRNIYSCRKIETALLENVHFMWLSGKQFPDFHPRSRAIVSRGLKKVIPYFYASSVIAY